MKKEFPVAKAILFDFGNVIFPLNWGEALKHFNIDMEVSHFTREFGNHPDFLDFELGLLSKKDFFERFNRLFKLDSHLNKLEEAWKKVIAGVGPGMGELLNDLKDQVPIYALTNTNETHYEYIQGLLGINPFKKVFASHIMHTRKPDQKFYLEAIREIGHTPNEILFFDDVSENIDAAKAVGLNAIEVFNSRKNIIKHLKLNNPLLQFSEVK